MPVPLAIHLGCVMTPFILLSYGKFAHGHLSQFGAIQMVDRKASAERPDAKRRIASGDRGS
jgi:hypothetical protein